MVEIGRNRALIKGRFMSAGVAVYPIGNRPAGFQIVFGAAFPILNLYRGPRTVQFRRR